MLMLFPPRQVQNSTDCQFTDSANLELLNPESLNRSHILEACNPDPSSLLRYRLELALQEALQAGLPEADCLPAQASAWQRRPALGLGSGFFSSSGLKAGLRFRLSVSGSRFSGGSGDGDDDGDDGVGHEVSIAK